MFKEIINHHKVCYCVVCRHVWVSVCVCVCVCVCVSACVHYVFVHHVLVYVRMHVCAHAYVLVCVCACVGVCEHACVCWCVCKCVGLPKVRPAPTSVVLIGIRVQY